MNWATFSFQIDVPLALVLWVAFLVQAQFWARSANADTNVDLVAKLPKARLRYTVFFALLLVVCWYCGFSIALLMVIIWVSGLVVAFLAGGDLGTRAGLHYFAAYLIREWAFGFPQMILHPRVQEPEDSNPNAMSPLAGRVATVTSTLRPTGEVCVDEQRYSARSESGQYVDEGTRVIVSCQRGRDLLVAVSGGNSETKTQRLVAPDESEAS
ncbi:MAG: NfeD family protein [Planctomycetota bacterium]